MKGFENPAAHREARFVSLILLWNERTPDPGPVQLRAQDRRAKGEPRAGPENLELRPGGKVGQPAELRSEESEMRVFKEQKSTCWGISAKSSNFQRRIKIGRLQHFQITQLCSFNQYP